MDSLRVYVNTQTGEVINRLTKRKKTDSLYNILKPPIWKAITGYYPESQVNVYHCKKCQKYDAWLENDTVFVKTKLMTYELFGCPEHSPDSLAVLLHVASAVVVRKNHIPKFKRMLIRERGNFWQLSRIFEESHSREISFKGMYEAWEKGGVSELNHVVVESRVKYRWAAKEKVICALCLRPFIPFEKAVEASIKEKKQLVCCGCFAQHKDTIKEVMETIA